MAHTYRVILKTCLTYQYGRYEFEKDRPQVVTNEADARYFRSRPEFRVVQLTEAKAPPPKPVPAMEPVLEEQEEQAYIDPEADSNDPDYVAPGSGDMDVPDQEPEAAPSPMRRAPAAKPTPATTGAKKAKK